MAKHVKSIFEEEERDSGATISKKEIVQTFRRKKDWNWKDQCFEWLPCH